MATLSQAQATTILRNLGWRIRSTNEFHNVVKRFQSGWNLGTALSVDGNVGPKTSAAMLLSESRRRAKKPTASAHYSFSEMACRCRGSYSSCARIWTHRACFQMMEKYRARAGAYAIVSPCRCPSENKSVGGSATSQHLTGYAVDVPAVYSVSTVRSWKTGATHYGYGSVSRKVKHIDCSAGSAIYVDGR